MIDVLAGFLFLGSSKEERRKIGFVAFASIKKDRSKVIQLRIALFHVE